MKTSLLVRSQGQFQTVAISDHFSVYIYVCAFSQPSLIFAWYLNIFTLKQRPAV